MQFIFLDTETTGLDPEKCELIEISAVKVKKGKIIEEFDSLVRPLSNIPPEIEKLTGISNEDVKNAPSLEKVRDDFLNFVSDDDILVAHNVFFDKNFLNHKNFNLNQKEIDTFDLATLVVRDSKSFSLEALSSYFEIEHEDAHRAMADVKAMFNLWNSLKEEVSKKWTKSTLDQINKALLKTDWAGKYFFEGIKSKKQDDQLQSSLFDCHIDTENTLEVKISRKSNDPHVFIDMPFNIEQEDLARQIAGGLIGKTVIANAKIEDVPHLDKSDAYICQSRLDKFTQKDKYEKDEILLYLKFLTTPNAKIFKDLNLKGDENKVFFEQLSSDDHDSCGEDCIYIKAKNEAIGSDLFTVNPGILTQIEYDNLIFLRSSNLEQILTNSNSVLAKSRNFETLTGKNSTQNEFLDGLGFGFGLIGKYVKERIDQKELRYPETILISKSNEHEIDFRNFAAGFEEAKYEFQRLFPSETHLFKELEKWALFFTKEADENQIKTITLYPDDRVSVAILPVALDSEFEAIYSRAQKSFFLSHGFPVNPTDGGLRFAFDTDEFEYIKLEDDFDFEHNSFLITPSEIRAGDEQDMQKIYRHIKTLFGSTSGNIICVFNSVSLVDRVSNYLEGKGDMEFVNFRDGNVGKNIQIFNNNSSKRVFLCPFYRVFDVLKGVDHFDIVYLNKFFFEPPSPLSDKRKSLYQNEFIDYILSKSIFNFTKIFNLSVAKKRKFVFYVADPKILNQNSWPKYYMDALPESLPKKFLPQEKVKNTIREFLS
jgi:DNA polymerase III epsilon subunit family exonuclease